MIVRLRHSRILRRGRPGGYGLNEVAVSVAFDDVAHRFGSLLQHLLVSEGCVGVATDLLGPLLSLCDDATRIANGLVEASIGLLVNIFGLWMAWKRALAAAVRDCSSRDCGFCGGVRPPLSVPGELALRFALSVPEVFVFAKRLNFLIVFATSASAASCDLRASAS